MSQGLWEEPRAELLIPLGAGGTRDSPWVQPGCREVELRLEEAVVMAEDEQAPEPSSDAQGLVAGSAEASPRVRSMLPLGGALPLVLGPQGLGQRTVRNGAAKSHAKGGDHTEA